MDSAGLGDAAESAPNEHEGLRDASRLIFERSRMAFVIVDDNLAIVDANESAATLTGHTRTALKTMHATELWLPAERLQAVALWERAMRSGTLVGSRRLLTKDGGTVPVKYSVKTQIAPNRNLLVWVPSLKRIPAHPEEEIIIESEERSPISRREAQVVTLLALGETGEDAAVSLGISPETVRTHVRNAMEKADARTRAHLVAIALHHGWIVSTD
jgi:PAS domain S-box-containing protein